jgi:ribosomal protein S18 acetylase RimI-like enzyme
MGRLADYMFGAGEPADAIRIIGRLFTQPRNRFSYQFTDVIEKEKTVIGILISYPGRIMDHLGLSMGMQLWRIYGAIGFARFARRALPLAFSREADRDEYFVNTLAVAPDFQGQGIGSYLLAHVENKAVKMFCRKCALSVSVSNPGARRLYKRCGYRVVKTVHYDIPEYAGHHRMVKTF